MAYILEERSHLTEEDKRNLDQIFGTNQTLAYGVAKDIHDVMVAKSEADNFSLRCDLDDVDLTSLPFLHATSGYLVDGMFRGVSFEEAIVPSGKVTYDARDPYEWKKIVYGLIFKVLFKFIDHRFSPVKPQKLDAKVTVGDKCFDLRVKREGKESFSFYSIDTVGFPDSVVSEFVISDGTTIDVNVHLKKWLLSERGARISNGSEKFMIDHLIVPTYLLIASSKLGDSARPNHSMLELELWYKMF